jgi:hypothetical protein
MKARFYTRLKEDQKVGGRCASCGAALQSTRSSKQAWSLDSLLPAGMNIGPNLCPVCRQRHQAHRIGAIVSARM